MDLDSHKITVLGKSQEVETVPISQRAREPLETFYEIQSPKSDNWKVFFSGHAPTQIKTLKQGLSDQGYDEEEIDSIISEEDKWEIFYQYDIAPTSLTTAGGRNLLENICEDNNIEIDGDYLKPFGARRHFGQQLFNESIDTAQKGLRSQTIDSVHQRYSR